MGTAREEMSSVHGVFEILVTFAGFKNVDLFHQGLYHIKCAIFTETTKVHALPLMTNVGTSEAGEGAARNKPAHIIDHENAFCTQTFLIRYCEEEIELNDVGHFRLEVDAAKLGRDGPTFDPVIIELDLMYSSHKKTEKAPGPVEFASVAKHTFKCHRVGDGLYQFCPVTFDEFHFCLVDIAVHIAQLDLRFRAPPKIEADPEEEEEKGFFAKLFSKPPPIPPPASLAELIERNMPRKDDKVQREEFEQQIDFYHRAFGAPLINSYQQLQKMFGFIKRQECEMAALHPGMLNVEDIDIIGAAPGEPVVPPVARLANNLSPVNVADLLQRETAHLAGQVFVLWNRYMDIARNNTAIVHPMLEVLREDSIIKQWNESIFRETLPIEDCMVPSQSMGNKSEAHSSVASTLRKSEYYRTLEPLNLEDISPINGQDSQPIFFEQRYVGEGEGSRGEAEEAAAAEGAEAATGQHLVIFVHGFMGNSYDLRLMRNHFAITFPHFDYFMSTANEESTLNSIEEMGLNLATEIHTHISGRRQEYARISFVGFSLGCVLVRACLADPVMQPYISRLWTFLAMSGPHCGNLFSTSYVVDS